MLEMKETMTNNNNFSSISTSSRSLHVQVARSIARRILSGELPQGSIVPNEMTLCSQFGVSRTRTKRSNQTINLKRTFRVSPQNWHKSSESSLLEFLRPPDDRMDGWS